MVIGLSADLYRVSRANKIRGWGTLAAVVAILACDQAAAQHTIDGTLSPAQTLAGPHYTIGANLGRQVGGNLFQSFGIFGLSTGETANFTGPNTVSNVIGRVTGGSQSSIDGTIHSSIAGANLYLIHPAGIVFGPSATINVSGSFRAASADYLKMADGAKFQATNPNGSVLRDLPQGFEFAASTAGHHLWLFLPPAWDQIGFQSYTARFGLALVARAPSLPGPASPMQRVSA